MNAERRARRTVEAPVLKPTDRLPARKAKDGQSVVKGGNAAQGAKKPHSRDGQMNKLEARYAREVLDIRRYAGEIIDYWYEPLRFRLAKNTNYTGDFIVQIRDGWELHEVKGWSWDAGLVRLKVVAEMSPFNRIIKGFYLCKRIKGEWIIKKVGFQPSGNPG